ncbi:hypothetical protein K0M31_017585 [Melipona bicolor]|uniref:Uncharacterized protein n=1 Tax=Melipona bicolor TaxID=60889 RepID=A0AA40G5W1_9HYME|nr:hypothetical protein K0M31_017585 [Melipona bicolor]
MSDLREGIGSRARHDRGGGPSNPRPQLTLVHRREFSSRTSPRITNTGQYAWRSLVKPGFYYFARPLWRGTSFCEGWSRVNYEQQQQQQQQQQQRLVCLFSLCPLIQSSSTAR